MKKIFLILAITISIVLPNRSISQIDMGTAFSSVKANVFNDDVSNYHITALPNAIPPQTQIVTMDSIVVSPNFTSWFFCADDNPFAVTGETSHCKYIFVNTSNGNFITKNNCARPIDSTLVVLNRLAVYDALFTYNVPNTVQTQQPLKHNYAIIINGGESRLVNYNWYWKDCSLVYKILVNHYNYDKNKIYVLMADGKDPRIDMHSFDGSTQYITQPLDLDGDGIDDIKYSARKATISAIFDTLARKITSADNVFIYVTDHGGEGSTIETWNNLDTMQMHDPQYPWEYFTQTEFANEINKLSVAKSINVVMNPCYSGGYISSLDGNNRVITTSCAAGEKAWPYWNYSYSDFTYHWASAVLGYTPTNVMVNADSNLDGYVSMKEAYRYSYYHRNTNRNAHPQFNGSTSGLGDYLTMTGSYGQMLQYPFDYDLYISDDSQDNGTGVSNFDGNSPDIWVRNFNDGGFTHQDPIRGDSNYVCVRIHNRGTTKSSGILDTLRIYTKHQRQSTNYGHWSSDWDLESTIVVPPIQANRDTVLRVKVYFSSNPFRPNYTIMARINSDIEPMLEDTYTLTNIIYNNNISAKNVTTVQMNYTTIAQQSIIYVATDEVTTSVGHKLRFQSNEPDEEHLLTDEAEIHVILSEDFINNLTSDAIFSGMNRLNDSTFLITSPSSYIEGFNIYETGEMTAKVNVNFLTRRSSEKNTFNYNVLLENNDELEGAINIQAEKPARQNLFQANAGNDIVITPNSDVIFEGVDIIEDAVYKWYSLDGQLLHTGRVFDTNLSNAGQYVLEVTALSDGFKDYDTVKVIVNPNTITSITPNPVLTGNITVCFTLDNSVNEAKLYIYSSPLGTLQGSCNILNTETYKTIDVTAYAQGSYLVVLVCDGVNTDSKLFVKQ